MGEVGTLSSEVVLVPGWGHRLGGAQLGRSLGLAGLGLHTETDRYATYFYIWPSMLLSELSIRGLVLIQQNSVTVWQDSKGFDLLPFRRCFGP